MELKRKWKMELKGKWKSQLCPEIFGVINIKIPYDYETKENQDYEVVINYDLESCFNSGNSVTLEMNGTHEDLKKSNNGFRFLLRNKNFKVEQYFTMTFATNDMKLWSGYLSCIFPCDSCKILLKTKNINI